MRNKIKIIASPELRGYLPIRIGREDDNMDLNVSPNHDAVLVSADSFAVYTAADADAVAIALKRALIALADIKKCARTIRESALTPLPKAAERE